MNNLSIKEWATNDRPREKLLTKGVQSLSDAELLGILLGTGTREMSAVDLGRAILACSENNLVDLGRRSVEELVKVKGIGRAKAIAIVAAMELGRRRDQSNSLVKAQIKASSDVFAYFQPILADLKHEEFWVLFLS